MLQFGSVQAAFARGAAATGRAPRAGTTPKSVSGAASPVPDVGELTGADVAAPAAAVPATAAATVAPAAAPSVSQPRMFKFVPLCHYI
jgi:hypothetical protein